MMEHFVEVFRGAEAICIPSSSCVAMIRDHYPKMADSSGDAALRRAVKNMLPRIYEFTELLVDKLDVTDVGAFFPHAVALHPSCHSLRSLHLGDRPAKLLNGVRGLTLVNLPEAEECCGFGGTFAVKNADVSVAMLSDKIRCILNSGAEVCAAVDNSCLMHIGGALSRQRAGVRVLHLAEILASSDGKGMSA
jgi:L-lactate dehydrogenase complex protein LldE